MRCELCSSSFGLIDKWQKMNKKKLKSMELWEKVNSSQRSYQSSNLVKKWISSSLLNSREQRWNDHKIEQKKILTAFSSRYSFDKTRRGESEVKKRRKKRKWEAVLLWGLRNTEWMKNEWQCFLILLIMILLWVAMEVDRSRIG